MMRVTFSRYTLPGQTEPVYDVLVNGCASGFRPQPDKARALNYLDDLILDLRLTAGVAGVEVSYWDGDAGEARESAADL